MACVSELTAAESCVTSSASACSVCIPAFPDFQDKYENEYKRTMAFEAPGTDIFCERSSFYVCEVMKESNCCCNAEIDSWAKCAYEEELGPLFGATCSYGCGDGTGGDASGESGSMMMSVVIAVVVIIFCCCGGGFWYRRRKRRFVTDNGSINGKSFDETWSDDDIESNKRGNIKKNKQANKKSRKRGDPEDSDDESYYGRSTKVKNGRKASNKNQESHDHSSSCESSFQSKRRGKRNGNNSKYASESDSDSASDTSHERKTRKSEKRRKKNKSKNMLDSSSSEEDEVRSLKSSRNSRNNKNSPTVEESIRQGRTILKSVKSSPDVSMEMQETMNKEMNALIAQLKTQRLEMESKLKASEQEAAQLRQEKGRVAIGGASSEPAIEIVTPESELEAVRKEREQMSKMIKRLESAKNEMSEKLKRAQAETEVLKIEKEASTQRVTEITREKEALTAKIEKIESTQGEIKTKLQESEDKVSRLQAEEKMKTLEIQAMRGSVDNRLYLDEAEAERRLINDQLQQQEFERQQMLHMMDQLDEARARMEYGSGEPFQAVRRGSNRSLNGLEGGLIRSGSNRSLNGLGGGGLIRSGSQSSLRQLEQTAYMGEQQRPGMPRAGSAKSLYNLQGGNSIAPQMMQQRSSFAGLVEEPSNLRPPIGQFGGVGHFDSHSYAGIGQQHQQFDNRTYAGFNPQQGFYGDNQTYAGASLGVAGGWQDDASALTDSKSYAGWLGDNIASTSGSGSGSRRTELSKKKKKKKRQKDPSQHVRSMDYESSNNVRAKREKARASERKLREKLDRSRSPSRILQQQP